MTDRQNMQGSNDAGAGAMRHPTCKVCNSPKRRDIELALLVGESRQAIADRFSTEEQLFNRQNMANHYHHHMRVVEQALAAAAEAERKRQALDVPTAALAMRRKKQLLEDLFEVGVSAVADGRGRWSPGEVLA
ncbi:MAG TPA: hypothetical protein VK898_18155, partial [Chloroflexota bacterium]|nr:hypothetical protein [Chloroflexota bacterium]